MGSHQLSDELPMLAFGYSISDSLDPSIYEFPMGPPPPMPDGDPILSNPDLQPLQDFFMNIVQNNSGPGFDHDRHSPWSFPVHVLGHTTSLGSWEGRSEVMEGVPLPRQPMNHPHFVDPAVMNAAAALSGQTPTHAVPSELLFNQHAPPPASAHVSNPQALDRSYNWQDTRGAEQFVQSFPNVLYRDGRSPPQPALTRYNPEPQVQFGSDPNFRDRYQPSWAPDAVTSIDNNQAALLGCFTRTESAAPTRVSSPVPQAPPALHLRGELTPGKARAAPDLSIKQGETNENGDAIAPPEPRRKSSAPEQPGTKNTPNGKAPRGKKRQASGVGTDEESASAQPANETSASAEPEKPASTKRRKKQDGKAKAPRQNLTDMEKRANHIKSEQRRRHFIKNGYTDVETMLEIKENGMSKSATLIAAADRLEMWKARNKKLADQLAAFKAAQAGRAP